LSGDDLEHFPWIVRDERFVLGWSARPRDWWLMRELLSKLMKRQDYPATLDLQVIEVTADRIILRASTRSLDIVLTRASN